MYDNPWPGIIARKERDEAISEKSSIEQENDLLRKLIRKIILKEKLSETEIKLLNETVREKPKDLYSN